MVIATPYCDRENMMSQYHCVMCNGVFEEGWTKEEAIKELAQLFPGVSRDNCVVVCDDCFQELPCSEGI